MSLLVASTGLLGDAGEVGTTSGGRLAMGVMLGVVLATTWVALGIVCWLFYRAKRRADAERGRETEWWSARSS